jgi:hypothetical protein
MQASTELFERFIDDLRFYENSSDAGGHAEAATTLDMCL